MDISQIFHKFLFLCLKKKKKSKLVLTSFFISCITPAGHGNIHSNQNATIKPMRWKKTSRVTRVTLVLWIGNETLRSFSTLWERLRVTESWTHIESRQFIGWWRDAVSDAMTSSGHTGERAIHSSDFSAEKNPVRQREKLGSERSVSFPIQRTRVTRVTRDVLFHR